MTRSVPETVGRDPRHDGNCLYNEMQIDNFSIIPEMVGRDRVAANFQMSEKILKKKPTSLVLRMSKEDLVTRIFTPINFN